MDEKIIVDDHIKLVVKNKEMAAEMYAIIATEREYLRRFLPWADLVTNVTQQELILTDAYLKSKSGEAYDTAIYYDDRIVGSMSLNEISQQNKFADIGYWLAEEMQGYGIVTRSVAKLIEYGFNELKLHKIILEAASDNAPSNGVAERIGMQLEAKLADQILLPDGYHDLNVYCLFNPGKKNK